MLKKRDKKHKKDKERMAVVVETPLVESSERDSEP